MRDKINLTKTGHSLYACIPAHIVKELDLQAKMEIPVEYDAQTGVLKMFLNINSIIPDPFTIPEIFRNKAQRDMVKALINLLRLQGPKKNSEMTHLFPNKELKDTFVAAQNYYMVKGNMYRDEYTRLCWIDNPVQKPNVKYRKITKEESKQIAEENKKIEQTLSPDEIKQLENSLDAEIITPEKNKSEVLKKEPEKKLESNEESKEEPICDQNPNPK